LDNSGLSENISVAQLLAKIDRREPLLLLDVRNEEEVRLWKIEGRHPVETVHIPYFDFIEDEAAALARVPIGRPELVAVCAKGGSSAMVAEILRQSGFAARNLEGGMVAYGEFLQPVEIRVERPDAEALRLWQVNRRGKGCLSYVVVSAGEAAVIDPSRNTAVYEALAAGVGARITRVLDTHVHADHVSGGPELALRHSAAYAVDPGPGFVLQHRAEPPAEGDGILLGRVTIEVLRTPGHTPGSVCYRIAGRYLVSGDLLFTNSVGRPDLGGHAEEWARLLYRTLQEKLGSLPADTRVLPGHYASMTEIGPDGVVSARLGDLRERLVEFHTPGEDAFVALMVESVRTPPTAYSEIIKTNLGLGRPEPLQITEWELGKNECAASGRH